MTLRPGSGQNERLAFGGNRRGVVSAAAAQPWNVPVPAAAGGPPSDAASARHAAPTEPRDWAFTWTLVFTAVLFLRPQDVFPPLGALHLAELSAMGGLLSLVMGRLARRQTITRITPEFVGVLAFGAVILLTAPFSIWFGGAVGTFQDLFMKVILVYALAVNVVNSPKRLERLTWLLVLAIGYLAFRAVFDYVRGVNMLRGGTRVMGSVGGLLQNPNDMALHMVVFLPLATFMALQNGPIFKRLIAAGCGACMIGAIVASGSRGGFVGFAVMLLVLAAFAVRKRPAMVFAGALAVLCALPLLPSSYWTRIASITDESKDEHQSSQARQRLLGESFDAFVANPITGVGAGQFKAWSPQTRVEAWHESHNVWLQVAAELGIFGVAVFLFLVFRAFYAVVQTRRLLRRSRAVRKRAGQAQGPAPAAAAELPAEEAELLDAHSAAMAASLVGWFVCAFFASVAYNWTFYYLLALAAAPREILRDRLPVLTSRFRASSPAATAMAPAFAASPGKVRA